jgi:hypothetical protein
MSVQIIDNRFVLDPVAPRVGGTAHVHRARDHDHDMAMVELWIAFGINKEGGHGRGKVKGELDRDAERKLDRLGDDFPELFHMTRLGDTHAKILICDSRFSIATSYNWLSFKGDEQLEFRDERGYYVGLSTHVDELFGEYRQRFEPTAPKPAH